MTVEGLSINTNVEIEYEEQIYKSSVQDISEDHISFSVPINRGEYFIPHVGMEIRVIYADVDVVYDFQSIILGRKIDNIPIIMVSIPKKIKKIQRRDYVRITFVNNIKYWHIIEQNVDDALKGKLDAPINKGIIIDISGGGAKIIMNSNVKYNDFIMIEIPVENNNIRVISRVVRVGKDDMGRNVVGLYFEYVNGSLREKLINFVFKIMRIQRSKL